MDRVRFQNIELGHGTRPAKKEKTVECAHGLVAVSLGGAQVISRVLASLLVCLQVGTAVQLYVHYRLLRTDGAGVHDLRPVLGFK